MANFQPCNRILFFSTKKTRLDAAKIAIFIVMGKRGGTSACIRPCRGCVREATFRHGLMQADVPPDRSTRIETVCRPPDRTIGRTSSGHYPFCGTIYRIAETCLHRPSFLSFVAKRYAGYTKPVRVKVRDGLSPAPAFAHPASR